MHFTVVNSVFDNKVIKKNQFNCSWEKFVKMLSVPTIVPHKDDVKLISPVEYYSENEASDFTEDGFVRRCSDNIKLYHAIPVDIDAQMTIETAKERFKKYEYVLYSTFSHKTAKKDFKDCFRIFFKIVEPVSNADFMCRREALQKFIGEHDKSTLACSRSFFLPSCSQENSNHAYFHHNLGNDLDVISFEPTIEIPYVPDTNYEPPTPEFKEKVLEQLCRLRVIDYDVWWKIGSAMQEAGYRLDEFEQVSRMIRSHRLDTMKCKSQWNCSKRKHIPFGYLVNLLVDRFGAGCLKMDDNIPKNSTLKTPYERLKNIKLTKF